MTPTEFARLVRRKKSELEKMVRQTAPRVVGVKALNFYRENYRKGGFVDGGFHAWQITKRQLSGLPGAANKYGPLLSKRNRMFSETRYATGDASVTICNNTKYAKIHNEGGEVEAKVSEDMRKYFWAMYYKYGGGRKTANPAVERYKWMALTKKGKLRMAIPKRPFIYKSRELSALVRAVIKEETKKILNP